MTLLKFDHCHSDFTWNPILVNSNGQKMSFLAILEILNFDFSQFEQLSSLKYIKNQNSEPLKLPKMTFWNVWICPNLISHKIWVAVKFSNFYSQSLTSHFESFWSIVLLLTFNLTEKIRHIPSLQGILYRFQKVIVRFTFIFEC